MITLSLRDVTFDYPGSVLPVPLVDDWSDDFTAGSVTAITGPSGCGKSTRLYVLALLLRAQSGIIQVEGVRVDNLPDSQKSRVRANTFGFVFQDAALDSTRSVLDNVLETSLYRGESRSALRSKALELLEEMGVDIPMGRRPGQVSGGQAQRIALCRALIGQPKILVADEPTGNLDSETAQAVLSRMRSHADDGGCVIVVTHDQSVSSWADDHRVLAAPST